MQLCGVNNKPHFKIWNFFKGSLALLVLLFFIGAPLLEAFHEHDEHSVQQTHSGKSIEKIKTKCKVCEHLSHHHTTPFISPDSITLLHFEGKCTFINTFADQHWMALSGLSWSNKGPPAIA